MSRVLKHIYVVNHDLYKILHYMTFYKKEDTVYKDYQWTVVYNDDPKVAGKPDSTLLNRYEGYGVLYFINAFAE